MTPLPFLRDDLVAASVDRPYPLRERLGAILDIEPARLCVVAGLPGALDLLLPLLRRPGAIAFAGRSDDPALPDWRAAAAHHGVALSTDGNASRAALVATGVLAGNAKAATVAAPTALLLRDDRLIDLEDDASPLPSAVNHLSLRGFASTGEGALAEIAVLVGAPETIAALRPHAARRPLPASLAQAALDALGGERLPLHSAHRRQLLADRDALADRLRARADVTCVVANGPYLTLSVDDAGLARDIARAEVPAARVADDRLRLDLTGEAARRRLRAILDVDAPPARTTQIVRNTAETRIALALNLDEAAPRQIATGVHFYDHMLDQIAAHGGFSLVLHCEGDVAVDAHHSVEDCAIALGAALRQALGDRRGIGRFGFTLPMDESRAEVLIDLSGRPYCRFEGQFTGDRVGDLPLEMVPHIFRSFADSLGATLHIRVEGDNDHHQVEACFKALGRALRQAIARDAGSTAVPSTKGVL